MVEFPLVAGGRARGLRRKLRNLSQIPPFADINFASSNRRLTQADMWETSTFTASFHARLNVAPQATIRARRIQVPPASAYRLKLARIGVKGCGACFNLS